MVLNKNALSEQRQRDVGDMLSHLFNTTDATYSLFTVISRIADNFTEARENAATEEEKASKASFVLNSGNIKGYYYGISGNGNDYWGAYDLGLQNSYLILKAKELGYDTLIMGLRDEEKLRAYFNIPEDEIMLPVIAIGKANSISPFSVKF